jgi:hypothetical protein
MRTGSRNSSGQETGFSIDITIFMRLLIWIREARFTALSCRFEDIALSASQVCRENGNPYVSRSRSHRRSR